MDGSGFEHAGEQVVPKALDLHVFAADEAKVDEHIAAHQELHNAAGMSVALLEQQQPQRKGNADVAEIEQVEDIVFGKPQCDGDGFESEKQQERRTILFHGETSLGQDKPIIAVLPRGCKRGKAAGKRERTGRSRAFLPKREPMHHAVAAP